MGTVSELEYSLELIGDGKDAQIVVPFQQKAEKRDAGWLYTNIHSL